MDEAAPAPPSLAMSTSPAGSRQPSPPPPPEPSSDPNPATNTSATTSRDLFELPPVEAMRLLSTSLDLLVRATGDIPPAPLPPRTHVGPRFPELQLSGLQAEKESIVRSRSEQDLAATPRPTTPGSKRPLDDYDLDSGETKLQTAMAGSRTEGIDGVRLKQPARRRPASPPPPHVPPIVVGAGSRTDEIDGVRLKQPARRRAASPPLPHVPPIVIGAGYLPVDPREVPRILVDVDYQRESPPQVPPIIVGADSEPENLRHVPPIIVDANSQPVNLQHCAITRKFYSKREPVVSIHQYLERLHDFCPMSIAVYIAASLYIHRLAIEERILLVTPRNAHRLVLAGLRIAMKAHEDLPHLHSKFARVGGVTERELSRLEISFCFLAGFELVVREEALRGHWEALKEGRALRVPETTLETALETTLETTLEKKPPDVTMGG